MNHFFKFPGALWRMGLLSLCLALTGLTTSAAENVRSPDQDVAPPIISDCSKAENFKEVPGLGPTCKLPNGNYTVRLKDGFQLETHGGDGMEIAVPDVTPLEASTFSSSHTCVSDLVNDYYGLLIYVRASDRPDNYATVSTTIRNNFHAVQDKLNNEALEFGFTASYKMVCNADGSARIDNVQLATPFNNTTFSTVMSDLRAQGYTNGRAKYWIWFDGRPPTISYCGIANLRRDDRPTVDNANNGNGSAMYAMSVSCNALMHENGHNLGAVQNSAPNTSGAGHCNDDRDVMCYNDGGPNSGGYRNNVCTDREHYDCNHNDYFHPNPPADNYLASHWNIGACYVRYIQRSGCGGTPTPTRTLTNTPTPTPTPSPTSTPMPAIFSDDFETNQGWVPNPNSSDTATTGRWERGDPQSTSSSGPKQLGNTVSGVNDLVTGRLAGSSVGTHDIDGGATSIQSPAITLTGGSSYTLRFSYYFSHLSNSSSADFLRVKIVSGTTTTTVFEELGTATDDDAVWANTSVSLDAFAGQTIRLLIEAADAGSASLVEAAVDNVSISSSTP